MKEKMRHFWSWGPGPAMYTAGAAALLFLCLVPLLRLADFSVPWYDDYNYGRYVRDALVSTPGVEGAFLGAFACIKMSWYAWQGTYGSIFFMALMPGVFGESFYKWGPVFLIFLLCIAVSALVYNGLRALQIPERLPCLGFAFLAAAMAELLIYTAREGFYWYNGGVHYVGMHSFGMLFAAAALRTLATEKTKERIGFGLAAALLALPTAGGNLVTTLQGLLVILMFLALGVLGKKKSTFFLLPAGIVYLAGFYMNVTAPGNAVRAVSYDGWGMPPMKAIAYSFLEAIRFAPTFTGWGTLVFLALALPLAGYLVRRTKFSFPLPVLVSFFSFCFYATGFTPSLYSMGHAGLSRTLNAVKITWQLMLWLNLIYWCGYLVHRGKKEEAANGRICHWWRIPVLGLCACVIFAAEPNRAGTFSSYGAYHYVHSGEANNFYQEYLDRVNRIKEGGDVVEVPAYHWKPWFLYMGDLSEDPQEESNRALAAWYDKDQIICITD